MLTFEFLASVFELKDNVLYFKGRALKTSGDPSRDWYLQVEFNGLRLQIHRVIYSLFHKIDLADDAKVDHKNGVKQDNRPDNLRLSTQAQNGWNRVKLNANNKSGVLGVCFCKRLNMWASEIRVQGVRVKLGHFKTIEEAAEARRNAAALLHGEFATKL